MRLRKKWWARPMLEESPLVVIDPKEKKGNWSKEFKNSNPIYLELGCGRGKFISTQGENNPDINYIAIDIKDEVLIYTLRNVQEKEIENVRIIPLEIAFIEDIFDKDEIERIYINFCNPWPKKSHNKRRLTHTTFLERYKRFIKPNTEVWFKTDDKDLFEASLEYFPQSGFEVTFSTYDLHNSDFEGNVMTEYEEKFTKLGMKTMCLIAKLK